jgi:hypothetical protein
MFQLCYNSIKEETACFKFMFQVEKNSLALLMRVSSFSNSIYKHFFKPYRMYQGDFCLLHLDQEFIN